jgi:hypothetical protein
MVFGVFVGMVEKNGGLISLIPQVEEPTVPIVILTLGRNVIFREKSSGWEYYDFLEQDEYEDGVKLVIRDELPTPSTVAHVERSLNKDPRAASWFPRLSAPRHTCIKCGKPAKWSAFTYVTTCIDTPLHKYRSTKTTNSRIMHFCMECTLKPERLRLPVRYQCRICTKDKADVLIHTLTNPRGQVFSIYVHDACRRNMPPMADWKRQWFPVDVQAELKTE